MEFTVRALSTSGKIVSLKVDAPDLSEAKQQITDQGYGVIGIKTSRVRTSFKRTRFPLLLFSRELLVLLKSGLSIVEATQTLAAKDRGASKRIMDQLVRGLHEGFTFSRALQQLPAAFPSLYVAMVQASERSGDLVRALERYMAYRTQLDTVRKKIVSASLYPILLLVVGSLVTLFLLMYVVPKFSHVYEDLGQNMPTLSRWLMDWGQFFEGHSIGILLASVCIGVPFLYGLSQSTPRAWIVSRLWQLPVIGERMRIYELARFYRSLGMLLYSGVPLVTAMTLTSGLLSPALRTQLNLAVTDIRAGQPLSRAMESHGLTTIVALRMMQSGERSGQQAEMLDHAATFYDEELAAWVDWFIKLFEPILMAIIGVVIGAIVVLMYMPVFELAGSLQ